MTATTRRSTDTGQSVGREPLAPAAERALAEAEERRRARAVQREKEAPPAREVNGRGGLDPVRYGDWEVKGLISDF